MKINLIKLKSGALVPSLDEDEEKLGKVKAGIPVSVELSRPRNSKFHRKFFAMLNYAYDVWEPDEVDFKHGTPEKNNEQFRKDVIILAGFYNAFYRLDGTVRIEAKSISFASMEEEEFEKLYSKVVDVILQKVLTNYTRENLDEVVNDILGFTR